MPFILLFLLVVLPQLLVLAGWVEWGDAWLTALNGFFVGVFVLSALLVLVTAWRVGWPRWSASWFLVFWALALAPLLLLSTRFEDSSWFADVFSELIAVWFFPMLVGVGLYFQARTDALKSLLAVLLVWLVLWRVNLEFVPDQLEAPIVTASLLIYFLAAFALCRQSNWKVGIWVALLANACVGWLFSYLGIYHGGTLPFTAAGPSPLETLKSFLPQFTLGAAIALGPLLAVEIRRVGRRSGISGSVFYHLALFGMLLSLAALVAAVFLNTDGRMWFLTLSLGEKLPWLVQAGLLLYLAGMLLLAWTARRQQALTDGFRFTLAAILFLLLPLALMPAASVTFGTDVWDFSLMAPFNALPFEWQVAIGFIWVALATWLLTRKGIKENQQDG
jgi:hypothetical protein